MVTQDPIRPSLPDTGYLRLPQVLQFIPIGRSSWWRWVAQGKAPKPFKIGKKTTVWKAQDIAAFIAELEQQGAHHE